VAAAVAAVDAAPGAAPGRPFALDVTGKLPPGYLSWIFWGVAYSLSTQGRPIRLPPGLAVQVGSGAPAGVGLPTVVVTIGPGGGASAVVVGDR
jgi:hypothetical protein